MIAYNNNESVSELTLGKVHLVDLAGTDRIADLHYKESKLLTETQQINKSILAFGEVIYSLSSSVLTPQQRKKAEEEGRASIYNSILAMQRVLNTNISAPTFLPPPSSNHVPYMNSKLTQLLKDSFGGSCLTFCMSTVTSESKDYALTMNTLINAARTMVIRNSPVKHIVRLGSNSLNSLLSTSNELNIIHQLKSSLIRAATNLHRNVNSNTSAYGGNSMAGGSVRSSSPIYF